MCAGIVVASPVEDYFLLIDGLEEPDRAACQALTGPLLDALDKAYDIPAEGTGFYALQSCANHSCEPNAHTLKARLPPNARHRASNCTIGVFSKCCCPQFSKHASVGAMTARTSACTQSAAWA